ncbi:MAG: lytic transglycosylase domain-containing protein [Proteobacteria bacterium]|nr:lytic transglycosylase domain-containing protein [Pseudomonadota bacterium]
MKVDAFVKRLDSRLRGNDKTIEIRLFTKPSRLTMDEDLPINRYLAIRACWIFIAVIVLLLLVSPLYNYNGQKDIKSVYNFIVRKSLPERYIATVPENSASYVRGKKAERLFHPIVLQAANRHQVDPALVKAIIMAESSYDPRAVSKKGAKGLMQLMPETARALGVEDSFNPEHNIHAGVRYFKHLMNQFDGDARLALAAYNAGSRKVRQYQGIPPYRATKYYIKRVFRYYKYYKEEMAAEASSA